MRLELKRDDESASVHIGAATFSSIEEVQQFVETLFEAAFIAWPDAVPEAGRTGARRVDREDTDARYREFLELAEGQGLTCPEIGDAKGIPAKTVQNILYQARRARKEGRL